MYFQCSSCCEMLKPFLLNITLSFRLSDMTVGSLSVYRCSEHLLQRSTCCNNTRLLLIANLLDSADAPLELADEALEAGVGCEVPQAKLACGCSNKNLQKYSY